MIEKSKLRGYSIEKTSNGEWIYSDDKTSCKIRRTRCGHCGKTDTQDGHDGCLGILPEAMNVCCGHGNVAEAYVQYRDRTCIRGQEAINVFKQLGKSI